MNRFVCLLATFTLWAVAASALELRNDALELVFASPESGAGLLQVVNRRDGARFETTAERPLLWQLKLVGGDAGSGQVIKRYTAGGILETQEIHSDQGLVMLDNLAGTCRAEQRQTEDGTWQLRLQWNDLPLPEQQGSVEVTCVFELPPGEGPATGRLQVRVDSPKYALESALFPVVSAMAEPGSYDLLAPRLTFGGQYFAANRQSYSMAYPSIMANLPFFGLFRPDQGGIYWGIHDPAMAMKTLAIGADAALSVEVPAENAGVTERAKINDYVCVIAPLSDAWQTAGVYRQWLNTLQTAPAQVAPRHSAIDLWLNIAAPPEEMLATYRRARAEIDGVLAIHWYDWSENKFDTRYPEFFPTKPGFEEAVRAVTANGDFVVPYLNGHLWDTTLPSYESSGKLAAVQDRAGTIHMEDYNSGVKLAPMCPASPIYQQALADACRRLIELGVNGIYLDQIGQLSPSRCFNPGHPHPLGGGDYWHEGYRQILSPVLADAPEGFFFATENGAESYNDVILAYLVWTEVTAEDFPLLAQVYAGKSLYFGALAFENDDLSSFAATQRRAFLWGMQPGWISGLFGKKEADQTDASREKVAYMRQLIRWRRVMNEIYRQGELVGAAKFASAIPTRTVKWLRMNGAEHTEPEVSGTLWRTSDGARELLLLASIAPESRQVELVLPAAGEIRQYDADGGSTALPSAEKCVITLEPFGFAAVEVIRPR